MQLNTLDSSQVVEFLEEAAVLFVLEAPGASCTYVLEYGGGDLILTVDAATGEGLVTYPCAAFDAESGGSVHDHARATSDAH